MSGPAGDSRAGALDPTATDAAERDDEPQRDELQREIAAALKHDLAKYVAWRSANLDESAWVGPLEDLAFTSIRDDVLATSRNGDATQSAWEVFARHMTGWPGALPAELDATAAAVAQLRDLEQALRSDDRAAIALARPIIRAAQSTIRRELAGLCRRLAAKG